jgi:predicted transposase YdaD
MLNGQQEGAGDLNVIPVMISLLWAENLRMCKPPEHTLIGRSEGERQATLKIARTMLQNGIDRNTVMKMTGLTEDDLAQIRH